MGRPVVSARGRAVQLRTPTLATVRRMVAASNGLARASVEVAWVERPRRVRFPTGHVELRGSVTVAAPGFRTRQMPVSVDADGTWVGR